MDTPTLQAEPERVAAVLDTARRELIGAMHNLDSTPTREAFLAVSIAVAAIDDARIALTGEDA